MHKIIDIKEFEFNYNYLLKQISECSWFHFSKNNQLSNEIMSIISDIHIISNLSYSLKKEITTVIENFKVSDLSILKEINKIVYDLEIILVKLSKDNEKLEYMTLWFEGYHNLQLFFAQKGFTTINSIQEVSQKSIPSTENSNFQENQKESKIIKFSHLL